MKEEDVLLLAQLLRTMRDISDKIKEYYQKKDAEKLALAKKELLELQKKVNELLA